MLSFLILAIFVVQAAMSFQLMYPTIDILDSNRHVNGWRFAFLSYYLNYFESLSLLLIGILIVKFNRVSRRLSQFYHMIENPLRHLCILLAVLVILYAVLGFVAIQIWGPSFAQFRKLRIGLYSMFTMFTLHSNWVV